MPQNDDGSLTPPGAVVVGEGQEQVQAVARADAGHDPRERGLDRGACSRVGRAMCVYSIGRLQRSTDDIVNWLEKWEKSMKS